ncbi:hypothetical protein [Actinokineospora iranica]|uniref:Uncharacterized protein n=1 Tax=Actinokineospora iranica TaxID=1271860 RepID=A0A1G6VRC6_9PSEU|nr:hypothetical protein [Actinokineospora iranica]SDD56162.1 hypothetical protein SAMN05216174_11355 [Actinokineospora iranica]
MRSFPPGTDEHDLAVNFGGLRYGMFFGPAPTRGRPPASPPPAARSVEDSACPLCRFWRRFRDACDGHRGYSFQYEPGGPVRRIECPLCREDWHRDLAWFRFALRDPAAAAADLRTRAHQTLATLDAG